MYKPFKHIYIFFAVALFCIAAGSCFKDKGNYNYSEVTNLIIDTFGNKVGAYQDSFFLTPRITAAPDSTILNDTARFDYVWTAAVVGRDPLKDVALILLSTSRNLRTRLTMRPTNYIIYLKVTDRITGNMYYQQTNLAVTTSTYSGWLLLSDVNNLARIDMISFAQAPATDTTVLTDILNGSGIPEMHGPREITYAPTASQGTYAIITAADGGQKVEADLFKWKSTYNLKYDCLFDIGNNFSPGYVFAGNSNSFMLYCNNNFYYQDLTTTAGYGLPVNQVNGETSVFDPSPYLGKAVAQYNPVVLFDRTKKRFVRLNEGAAKCVLFAEPDPAKSQPAFFLYNNVNMDLLYMVTNQATLYTYAVLKDPATNKVWVYCFKVTATSLIQNFAKELTGTDILNAEKFAINPEFGYLFYNVGSKVYEVDFDNPSVSKMAIDLGSKKISLLKFHQFRAFTAAKYADKVNGLLVGSYDPAKPAESCGTLSQFRVPGLFGDPVLTKSWSGFGKIAGITYRER